MKHVVCNHLDMAVGLENLDFYWDEETGEVSGKSAQKVRKWAEKAGEMILINPIPSSYQLSDAPLKSKRDLAALLGMWYELPAWLAAEYPRVEDDAQEGAVY